MSKRSNEKFYILCQCDVVGCSDHGWIQVDTDCCGPRFCSNGHAVEEIDIEETELASYLLPPSVDF